MPEIGETWRDLRPMTDRSEWRNAAKYQRIVVVTAVDHSYVEGMSSWRERTRAGWKAMEYPAPRKTRILGHVFGRRFVYLEG
jgi:hypothetical protein